MLRVMGSVRRGQVFCQDPQITTLLQPWKIPAKSSPADAFADLEAVVRAYPPGLQGEMQEMHGNARKRKEMADQCAQDKYVEVRCVKQFHVKVLLEMQLSY